MCVCDRERLENDVKERDDDNKGEEEEEKFSPIRCMSGRSKVSIRNLKEIGIFCNLVFVSLYDCALTCVTSPIDQ